MCDAREEEVNQSQVGQCQVKQSEQGEWVVNLNGWQRLGVVASVLWGISAAFYERSSQVSRVTSFHESEIRSCMPELSKVCIDAANEFYSSQLALSSGAVSNIVVVAVGPVLAGWAVAYLVVKVFRWVKAGF